jgi:hypothetical protein
VAQRCKRQCHQCGGGRGGGGQFVQFHYVISSLGQSGDVRGLCLNVSSPNRCELSESYAPAMSRYAARIADDAHSRHIAMAQQRPIVARILEP